MIAALLSMTFVADVPPPAPGWRGAGEAVVKIVGAGAGRVAGQGTGVAVSADGWIVTAASAMLSDGDVTVVFADGRRRPAVVKALDLERQLAVLHAPATNVKALPWAAAEPPAGSVVYAWSNCFAIAAGEEAASLQRGIVAGKAPLTGAVGLRSAALPGPALLLDIAVSNPNAAGGAVVNPKGELVGLVGRELRHPATGAWIHYAIPAAAVRAYFEDVRRGQPPSPIVAATTEPRQSGDPLRGLVLVLDPSGRTPPFIDGAAAKSSAERAGVRPDDLIVFVGARGVKTIAEVRAACANAPADLPLRLLVQRGAELVTVELAPDGGRRP